MSYKAMDWAFEQDCGDAGSKLVLLAIAKHVDGSNKAFPSVARIAKLCNMSTRTVHRKLGELAKAGLVTVKNRGKEGKKTSNLYTLLYETGCHIPPDRLAHRIDNGKTNNKNSISIHASDCQQGDKVDWQAMASQSMKGTNNAGNGNQTDDDL